MNLSNIDPGFRTQRLLLFTVDGSRSGYQDEKLRGLYERIREKVAVIGCPVGDVVRFRNTFRVHEQRWDNGSGICPQNGRPNDGRGSTLSYDDEDSDATGGGVWTIEMCKRLRGVGVINETFALNYFAHENPVGRYFCFGDG